ncbi:hypothetical protein V5O48_009715 [Marasmius crinis-equi]|uniref:Uncharacterized protein n=1 Tax=Marasmius crinis-equi TaxID=585013 RepID=A0ABR3FAB4_9AGAR
MSAIQLATAPVNNPLLNQDVILDILETHLQGPDSLKSVALLTLNKGLHKRIIYSFFDRVFIRRKSDLRYFASALLFRPTARQRVRHLIITYDKAVNQDRDIGLSQANPSRKHNQLGREDLLPIVSIISQCRKLTTLTLTADLFPAHRCREIRRLTFNNITHLDGPLWLVSRTITGLYSGTGRDKSYPPFTPLAWPALTTLTTTVQGWHPAKFLRRAMDFRHLHSLQHLRISFYEVSDRRARACLSSLQCPPSTKFALLSFTKGGERVVPFDVVDLSSSVWAHPKALLLAPRCDVWWLDRVAEDWLPAERYMSSSLLIEDTGRVTPVSELEGRAQGRINFVRMNISVLMETSCGYGMGFDPEWDAHGDDHCYFQFDSI